MPFVEFKLAATEADLVMAGFGAVVKVPLSKPVDEETPVLGLMEALLSVISASKALLKPIEDFTFGTDVEENDTKVDRLITLSADPDNSTLETSWPESFVELTLCAVVFACESVRVPSIASLEGVVLPDAWLVVAFDDVDHAWMPC